MLSDGAIYSSIDFTTKANYNSPGQTSQATPYATTQILHSSSIHELAVDLPEAQWKASLQAKQEMANLGYSLPDKNSCNNSKLSGCPNGNLRVCLYPYVGGSASVYSVSDPLTSKTRLINPDHKPQMYSCNKFAIGNLNVSTKSIWSLSKPTVVRGGCLKNSNFFPSRHHLGYYPRLNKHLMKK